MAERTRHDEEHERVLRDVLTGDRSRDEDAVRLLLAYCGECAEALADLEELADVLDADARSERDALGPQDDGEDARPPLEHEPDEQAPPMPPAWRRPLLVLAPLAAAALALLALRGVLFGPGDASGPSGGSRIDEPGIGLPLGESIRLLEPIGEVEAYGTFRWEADLPPGGWYTLQIWAERRAPGKQPLIVEPDLTEPTWTPSAEQLESLPGRIEVQVRVHAAGGTSDQSDRAEVWLRGF